MCYHCTTRSCWTSGLSKYEEMKGPTLKLRNTPEYVPVILNLMRCTQHLQVGAKYKLVQFQLSLHGVELRRDGFWLESQWAPLQIWKSQWTRLNLVHIWRQAFRPPSEQNWIVGKTARPRKEKKWHFPKWKGSCSIYLGITAIQCGAFSHWNVHKEWLRLVFLYRVPHL